MSIAKSDSQTPHLQRFSGEWKTKRLGEIAPIRNQKTFPAYVNPDTLCVELDHIQPGSGLLLEYSKAQNSTSSKYRFFAGDVLFGRLRPYLRKFWHADRDGICTTEIWPLMVNRTYVDSGFLHAIVQSERFIAAASISYGTHMPRADWGVMRNFEIHLPKIGEQRAIAEVLSDVGQLLNALEALIAKKQAIKQAVMQQLLMGRTRLPGFSGKWETKRLGEIAHIKTGSKNNEDKSKNGQYPFFVRSATVERINSYCYDGEAILVPGEGGIESIFHYINGRFDCHQRVYMINRFLDGVFGKLIYYIMVLQFGSHAMQNTVKATVDSLRLPTFKNFSFSIPKDTAEQHAIASVLSDIDAEIAALEQRRDKTLAIKQGMMQELLTGRVRLFESRTD